MFINVLILYLKECYWTLSFCMIFARSLLMLHVISCCTTPMTGISLLHLPCGHFAPVWLWICWILCPPPAWPWPVSWVDYGFFHIVTMSLFHGGMWLLNQQTMIFWILGPPPAWPWPISWVDCGFFHSVTMSLFLGGMWLLHQRDHHLFLYTFLVDCGSFNKAKKPVP